MRKKLLLLLALIDLVAQAKAASFQVFFTANRQGEIDPCHCTTNQIGGISRLANYLEKTKKGFKGASYFLDSGDTFFSLPKFPDALRERELSKAKLISKAYKILGADFISFGERDMALGLPVLSELLQATGAKFPPPDVNYWSTILEKENSKLGLIAVLKTDSLDKAVDELRGKKPDQIILLSHLGIEADKKLAEKYENVVIAGSHSLAGGDNPLMVGKSVIVETKEEGKNIGRIVFSSSDVTKATFEFVDLDTTFEKTNAVAKLVKEHIQSEKTKTITSDAHAKSSHVKNAYVANPFVCKECHNKQFEFWKNTKHASAYLVLYSKNQHFDSDCITCHVLGFDSKEGFNKISEPLVLEEKKKGKTPFVETLMHTIFNGETKPLDSRKEPDRHKLLHNKYMATIEKMHTQKKLKKVFMGVQCEHCHGNRSEHIASGARGIKTTVPDTCLSCHRSPNAPEFTANMIPLASCPK